jgi:hypothetical protein
VTEGGLTVNCADFVDPAAVAEMFAVVVVATELVGIEKMAVADPDATVTVAGGLAAVLSECKVTGTPLGPALPVRVRVAVDAFPPTNEVGLTVKLWIAAEFLDRVAVTDWLFRVAVMTALI